MILTKKAKDSRSLQAAQAEGPQNGNDTLYFYLAAWASLLVLLSAHFLAKRRAKKKSQRKGEQITAARKKTDDRGTAAIAQLKLTQNQLIQSEKMASLGELTANIAHEIQNPLNFVNNFSEVNREL